MGSEISLQLRLTDTVAIPVTLNKPSASLTKICQSSLKLNDVSPTEQIGLQYCVVGVTNRNTKQGLRLSPNQRSPMSAILKIEQDISEAGIKVSTFEHLQGDEDERNDLQKEFSSSIILIGLGGFVCIFVISFTAGIYERECEKKLKGIRQTLKCLDDSLRYTRGMEAEKSFRYSQLKTENMSLQVNLDKANKRNKNMLNLFRQNAVEIGFGRLRTSSTLPESLRKDVQRIWSHKYDILLEQNNQLKREAAIAELTLEDKDRQIEDLQQRLLNLAENLIQREKTIEKICTKFLSLKQRKDEQEVLLRGSVETLQDALQKAKGNVYSSKSESSIMPSKDAIIAREVRRSDRLAHENSLLRDLLQEANNKRGYRNSRTSSTVSLCG